MPLSPASIRNVMQDLEELGLVYAPHTSAGRVPTEKGYSYFVDSIGGARPLDPTNVAKVSEFFAAAHGAADEIEVFAQAIARVAGLLAHA